MKLISYSKNIKFNTRPDGSLKYERSTGVTINTPNANRAINLLLKLLGHLGKIYRKIKPKFSSW